jgi:hypothetical protein
MRHLGLAAALASGAKRIAFLFYAGVLVHDGN